MNKVYCFNGFNDCGCVYIAASNFKEARNCALSCEDITEHLDNPFIEIRGKTVKRNGKPITTEFEGELNANQLTKLELNWFYCENKKCEAFGGIVGKNDITVLNKDEYRCDICGQVFEIPYVY